MCNVCASRSLTRRGFVASALAALAAVGNLTAASEVSAQQNVISGEAALKRIMDGNARYAANTPQEKDFSAGRAARATAQYPVAGIVSCADSRVAPEFAFDQGPGDLFVVRVAGNFVNDDGLASLEYGTLVLGAPLIMVLGHTSCGAVSTAIKVVNEGLQLPGHLPELIGAIKPAVEAAKKENASDLLAAATIANVRLNVEGLKTTSPILSARIAEKKLMVVGGVYDLATGKIGLVS